ncbi:nSTAND1 domain-containing NTPase [Nostoc sp.]|uniref:WD40 domain-containing protein n=1 Tax=Nostoc sp. TaxID=1180 RepID=UPI002FF9417A
MAESDGLENILPDNERSLRTLARTLKLTQRRFSLILVRCNYTSLREQILQRLRQECTVEFAELVLPSSTTKLYSSILNQVENQPPAALMILGLESVQALDDLLVAANKTRDKFKSDFAFPIILWVTDRILHRLGRLAPDFNSWASPPIQFTISPDDMVNSLRQKAEQAFSGDADFTLDGYDLEAVQQDLGSEQQESDPELQASLAFMLGLLDYRKNRLDFAIAHYQQSLTFWQQNNNLDRQGILLLNIALAYYSKAEQQRQENQSYWEETKNYLQQSLEIFEQAQHPELVAKHISQLGEVLRRLKAWEELHKLAHKALKLHQSYDISSQVAQDYGFLAEVALEQSRWNDAHELAQKALETLEKIPNFLPQEQGQYHFLLAKSLRKLGELNEAVNTLEKARNESQSQYNPLLYIQILEDLHSLYFEQKQYERAFHVKQKQREIESQYGFRAFIGAGRLQPRRQVINLDNSPNQQSKEIAGEVVAAFGRQQDIKSLLHRIGRTDCKLTVIYGQSGVGKSSIVQAGLLPVLQLTPFDGLETLPILVQVYTAWEKECGRLVVQKLEEVRGLRLSEPVETSAAIIEQLRQNENRNLLTVLIFDQFEEFFFAYKDQASRRPFYDFLRDCLNISYVKVILSLRQDYLHYLLEWSRTTELPIIDDDILDKNILYYLGNFSPLVAKSVIKNLTENSQFYLEPDLIDALVEDLASELREVRPIELQVVGAQLQTEKIATLEQYRKNWLKEKLVERFLEEVVKDCGLENERAAQLVLYLLTNENNTRPLKTRAELEKDLATEAENLELVLEILVGSGLVFRLPELPGDRYQLVHDYLVPFIRQQRGAELLTKLKEVEEQQQRTQAELNRVLRQQLQTARKAGIGLATLTAIASGFAIFFLGALISGTDSQLNAGSAVSQRLLASNQDMEALIEGIRAAKTLKWWKIGIQDKTKMRVVGALQSAVYGIKERNTLEAHSDSVNTVSFSPNGQFIASGSNDKTVRLWRRDGSPLTQKPLQGHTDNVTCVTFSPDSKMIASGSEDKTVRIWGLNGKQIAIFKQAHNDTITNVSFSSNGQTIASGSADGTVKLWNLQGKLIATPKGNQKSITSISFSPDGKMFASVGEDGTVKFWNLNGKEIKTLNKSSDSPSAKISSVQFSSDSQTITTIGRSSLQLWHSNGTLKKSIDLYTSAIVSLSPDGKTIASGGDSSKVISLMSVPGQNYYQQRQFDLEGHRNAVTSLSFSPDGKMIASGSKDNTVKLWNIENRDFKTSDLSQLNNVSFNPDGQIIAAISRNNIKLWRRDGTLLTTLTEGDSAVSFSKNRVGMLASASQDSMVQLWRRDGKWLKTLQGETVDGSFSPDGQTIALVRNDHTVELSTSNGKLIAILKGHKDRVSEIKFSRDGHTLATVSKDKTIKLWKRNGTLLTTLEIDDVESANIGLSSNGETLTILGGDNTVKFWRQDGNLIKTLPGQGSNLMIVDFSPDGEILAIRNQGDDANKVQLWRIDGTLLTTLPGQGKDIKFVYFSPDSQTVVTINSDAKVQFWRRDGTLLSTFNKSVSDFSPDFQILVTSEEGSKKVQLWRRDGTLITTIQLKKERSYGSFNFSSDGQTLAIPIYGNTEGWQDIWRIDGTFITKVQNLEDFNSDSKNLFISTAENKLQLWRNDGTLLRTIQGFDKNQIERFDYKYDFSSDGKTLALVKQKNTVQLWQIDAKAGTLITTPQKIEGDRSSWVSDVRFIPNSDTLAVTWHDYTVKLWQIDNQVGKQAQLSKTFRGHSDWVTSVSISPDGKMIASASYDKTIKLWRRDGTLVNTLQGHTDKVNSVSFSPDGEMIASASDDKTIKLWQRDGTLIKTLDKHSNKINSVIFSPDGKTIASASDDQTVMLWQRDGTFIRSIKESYGVNGISFSPDSKMIASVSYDASDEYDRSSGKVKLWSLDGTLLTTYDRLESRDVSFSPDGLSIAAGKDAFAVWNFDLEELLTRGCDLAWDYLKNNPNAKKDSNLCDGIGDKNK